MLLLLLHEEFLETVLLSSMARNFLHPLVRLPYLKLAVALGGKTDLFKLISNGENVPCVTSSAMSIGGA